MDDNIMDEVEPGLTDVPGTICPPLLLTSNVQQTVTANAQPAVQPGISTSSIVSPASLGVSRPLKRYVRPRAKDDEEKQSRLEERRIANRSAAKASRERQKQTLEAAQLENDRLKAINNSLLDRLASLEQRVISMEERRTEERKRNEEIMRERKARGEKVAPGGMEQTYQPARPIMLDQQCPVPSLRSHLNLGTVVYALQMLMHSFALSMVLKMQLERRGIRAGIREAAASRRVGTNGTNMYSPWTVFPGDATPNSLNLSGAFRNEFSRRRNVKAHIQTPVRRGQATKEILRRIRTNTRKKSREYIQLIIKRKASGRRMNHK